MVARWHAWQKWRQMRAAQRVDGGFVDGIKTAWRDDGDGKDGAVRRQRERQHAVAFQPAVDELLRDDEIGFHDTTDLANVARERGLLGDGRDGRRRGNRRGGQRRGWRVGWGSPERRSSVPGDWLAEAHRVDRRQDRGELLTVVTAIGARPDPAAGGAGEQTLAGGIDIESMPVDDVVARLLWQAP